jgi:hypothetical protein
MTKKYISVIMLYIAAAMMLGHNMWAHHHHDEGHQDGAIYSHGGYHHHHHDDDHNDDEHEWYHVFSLMAHSDEGFVYLVGGHSEDDTPDAPNHPIDISTSHELVMEVMVEVRSNAPPYLSPYMYKDGYYCTGLRAPPVLSV